MVLLLDANRRNRTRQQRAMKTNRCHQVHRTLPMKTHGHHLHPKCASSHHQPRVVLVRKCDGVLDLASIEQMGKSQPMHLQARDRNPTTKRAVEELSHVGRIGFAAPQRRLLLQLQSNGLIPQCILSCTYFLPRFSYIITILLPPHFLSLPELLLCFDVDLHPMISSYYVPFLPNVACI